MNELDFIEALQEKTAGAKEIATGIANTVARHKHELAAGAAGAGLLSGMAYTSMRPGRGGKPSAEQKMTAAFAASNEAMKDQAERDNRPLTFREDVTDAVAPASKRMADVLARHPVKGALLLAPAGALAGLRILKALK